jgi:hypothetical protein
MKVHSKNRPFLCPYCKKGLKSKVSLASHLKKIHKPQGEQDLARSAIAALAIGVKSK